ncbi:MAG: ferredoxin [Ghiorsea sp.]
MNKELSLTPYYYHAMMCTGKSCGENIPLLKYVKQRIIAEGLDQGNKAVRVNRAGCLGVCKQGPIMVVYPEGVWYADLDEANIERIISSHFKQHTPVKELAFHQQPPSVGQTHTCVSQPKGAQHED